LARDIQGDIRAVLVVRHNGFHIEATLAEFLHRKPGASDRGRAVDVAERAGHVSQDTNLDGIGRLRARAAPRQPAKGSGTASGQNCTSFNIHGVSLLLPIDWTIDQAGSF
jgi:hypothetical protein